MRCCKSCRPAFLVEGAQSDRRIFDDPFRITKPHEGKCSADVERLRTALIVALHSPDRCIIPFALCRAQRAGSSNPVLGWSTQAATTVRREIVWLHTSLFLGGASSATPCGGWVVLESRCHSAPTIATLVSWLAMLGHDQIGVLPRRACCGSISSMDGLCASQTWFNRERGDTRSQIARSTGARPC